MPEPEGSWATMSTEELVSLLQTATGQYALQCQEVAIDEAAYHREFWSIWAGLEGSDLSVAAKNRHAEWQARHYQAEVILKTAIREGRRARMEALMMAVSLRRPS